MNMLTKDINKLSVEIEQHNKNNGKLMSYGQYVAMQEHPVIYKKLLKKHAKEKKKAPRTWSETLNGKHASNGDTYDKTHNPLDVYSLMRSMPKVGDIVYHIPSNMVEYDANERAKHPTPKKKRGVVIHSDPKKLNYVVQFEGLNGPYRCGYKVPGVLEIDGISY